MSSALMTLAAVTATATAGFILCQWQSGVIACIVKGTWLKFNKSLDEGYNWMCGKGSEDE